MDTKVNDKTLFDRESLATNFTTKWFETRVTCQMSLECAHLSKRLLTHVTLEPVGPKSNELLDEIEQGNKKYKNTVVRQCGCGCVFASRI